MSEGDDERYPSPGTEIIRLFDVTAADLERLKADIHTATRSYCKRNGVEHPGDEFVRTARERMLDMCLGTMRAMDEGNVGPPESDSLPGEPEAHFQNLQSEMADGGHAALANVSLVVGTLAAENDVAREVAGAALARKFNNAP